MGRRATVSLTGLFERRFGAAPLFLAAILLLSAPASGRAGGDMYVASRDTDSIKRYDRETGDFVEDFVEAGDGGLVSPQEALFGPDGHLFVTGFQNAEIKKYDGKTGDFIENFSKGYSLSFPTKMTFHTDGMIYVSQWDAVQNKVVRFDAISGEFVDEFTSTGVFNGCGHAWDGDGNLYVASWGTNGFDGFVHKFDPDGIFLETFLEAGDGGLSGPVNLWYDNGELFVVDWTIGDVLRYDIETGAFLGEFITGMVRTEGFVFDDDGFIYLCDWSLDRVNQYDSTGAFVKIFASGGGMETSNGVTFGPNTLTSVNEEPEELPARFVLGQNYPNPFNPTTEIRFTIPEEKATSLKIFDMLGQEIELILNETLPAGSYTMTWNAADQPSGTYFYQLQSGEFIETKKLILLR